MPPPKVPYLLGVEEMVNNTFNHPSVILWGFLNEGPSDEPQNRALWESIVNRFKCAQEPLAHCPPAPPEPPAPSLSARL